MLREYVWFHPAPSNFVVDKRRQQIWRRWAGYYCGTDEFNLLKRIEAVRNQVVIQAAQGTGDVGWLLRFRSDFRRLPAKEDFMGRQGGAEAIRFYMASCPVAMLPVCIWLLGRCGNRYHSYPLSEICRDQPTQTRKHLAKALRRLEEWWLLEELAKLYPYDKRLQRLAMSAISRRPFRERLTQYARSVDDSHAGEVKTPSQMPFWASEQSWERTPPKSLELIRRILRRIQHWVHWGVSP
jgi:hypothetical protein